MNADNRGEDCGSNRERPDARLQVAAIVSLIGLLVEVLCLLGKGPIAFLLFSGICAMLFAAGILLWITGNPK